MQIAQSIIPEDMIDLGLGQPGADILPLELLQTASAHALAHADPNILQYGADAGDDYFRLALARFLTKHYAQNVEPQSLFTTNGISQALDMICALYTKPGDTIFVEEPTYFLALNIFADYNLKVVPVPVDHDGLIVDDLESLLKKHQPVFIYSIPTFQNPSGVTLSLERRQVLLELCQTHNTLIIADEVYHLLAYTEVPPKPLGCWESEQVLSLGTFSKILAPGLRLGWIQASAKHIERFKNYGVVASGGGLNPFTSAIVRSALELGLQDQYLLRLKTLYAERSRVLVQSLRAAFPSVLFDDVAGGYFVWMHLPDVDATKLRAKAKALKVDVREGPVFSPVSSPVFSPSNNLNHHMRLCFAFYNSHDLQEGVRRLDLAVNS
jgi:2-aminoadipate transaminase